MILLDISLLHLRCLILPQQAPVIHTAQLNLAHCKFPPHRTSGIMHLPYEHPGFYSILLASEVTGYGWSHRRDDLLQGRAGKVGVTMMLASGSWIGADQGALSMTRMNSVGMMHVGVQVNDPRS